MEFEINLFNPCNMNFLLQGVQAMNLLKRLSVSIRSHLDDEAFETTLQERREAIALIKLQLSRMDRKLKALDTQLDSLRTDVLSWQRQAKFIAKSDKAQAIACLDRRDLCNDQIEQLHHRREKCQLMASHLAKSLSMMEQKLSEVEQHQQRFPFRDLNLNLISYPGCDKLGFIRIRKSL
jgi:predicted  nucleic acid-binding Zn-ribbon protein